MHSVPDWNHPARGQATQLAGQESLAAQETFPVMELAAQFDSGARVDFTFTNRSDNRRIRIISEADGLALPSK